jgi:hypothetical protein
VWIGGEWDEWRGNGMSGFERNAQSGGHAHTAGGGGTVGSRLRRFNAAGFTPAASVYATRSEPCGSSVPRGTSVRLAVLLTRRR